MRGVLRALQRGMGVVVMIDQDARGSGIFVPFFGRMSSTIPTVGTLHCGPAPRWSRRSRIRSPTAVGA